MWFYILSFVKIHFVWVELQNIRSKFRINNFVLFENMLQSEKNDKNKDFSHESNPLNWQKFSFPPKCENNCLPTISWTPEMSSREDSKSQIPKIRKLQKYLFLRPSCLNFKNRIRNRSFPFFSGPFLIVYSITGICNWTEKDKY